MNTKSLTIRRSGRVAFVNANRRLPRDDIKTESFGSPVTRRTAVYNSPVISSRRTLDLLPVEDMRTYNPENPFLARTIYGHRASTAAPISSYSNRNNIRTPPIPWTVSFHGPSNVAVCVRRQRRREVLHAKGIAGRRGIRKYHRNYYSSISCTR